MDQFSAHVNRRIPWLTRSLGYAEKGEVLGDHYKLLPVDLRDIGKLDDLIAYAKMDPRCVHEFLSLFY